MAQVVQVTGLQTREDAEQRAEDFSLDGVPVDILPQADGTFTVRATYPDDVQVPGAVPGPAGGGAAAPAGAGPAAPPAPAAPAAPQPAPAAPVAAAPAAPAAPGTAMHLSPKGAALIKSFEGCMTAVAGGFQAYLDPVNVLTIGWGHTNDNGRQFDASSVWTQVECDNEFLADMTIFENAVLRLVTVQLNQNQFDALVSFTYNLGAANLGRSTLLKLVNAGNFAGAAQQFPRWNKAGGKVLAGLARRRAAEAALFQGLPDGVA